MICLLDEVAYLCKALIKLIIHDPVVEPKPCHMFQLLNSILHSLIKSFFRVSPPPREPLPQDLQRWNVEKQVLTLKPRVVHLLTVLQINLQDGNLKLIKNDYLFFLDH